MISIYGIFKNNRCVYVGRTSQPWRRERSHKWRFGKKAEFRIFRQTSSEIVASRLEKQYILKFKSDPNSLDNHDVIPRGKDDLGRVTVTIAKDLHKRLKLLSAESGMKLERAIDEAVFYSFCATPRKDDP